MSLVTVLASAGLSFGLMRLNTDPSLLDYFKKDKEPRIGLTYVDRNGGSNPLTLVIAAVNGGKLDTKEEYQKMWALQDALEEHKGVGTVLSLPVLMAEGHRHPFAFLFSWNHLLSSMAIDSMVHLVFAVRRAQRDGKKGWDSWVAGRKEQWRGIVYSDVIIAAGFAIFALSNFPPTQRFGLVVVSGTVIDTLANLFLLPLLVGARLKTRPAPFLSKRTESGVNSIGQLTYYRQ